MTTAKTRVEPVEDRDLMRYYDGELDDERAAEVERWLEESDEGLDKLAALDLVGELIRARVDADDRADEVVDAVMARLADADGADAEPEQAHAESDVVPLKRPDRSDKQPETANDNAAPRIFLLAAAAAAAAAGLFFWGSQGPSDLEPPPHTRYEPTAPVTSDRAPKPAPETLAEVTADDEGEAVEIATVDFGSHRGSVFYVGDEAAGRTPVVWINDAGGE